MALGRLKKKTNYSYLRQTALYCL